MKVKDPLRWNYCATLRPKKMRVQLLFRIHRIMQRTMPDRHLSEECRIQNAEWWCAKRERVWAMRTVES
jgi:hypothetical protein